MKSKLNHFKYQDIYWINFIALFSGTIMYFILDNKIEILTAFIATGISISIGIRNYKIENDKLFKELFIGFNFKYDKFFNNTLNKIDINKHDSNFKLSQKEDALIKDYLNLCAEEYLWYVKGRIDKSVWTSWENGMVYYLNISCINKIVLDEKNQKDSYYGLFNCIGHRINNWN